MSHFHGPCPRCGDLLSEYTWRCPACGALTGLSPPPRKPYARHTSPLCRASPGRAHVCALRRARVRGVSHQTSRYACSPTTRRRTSSASCSIPRGTTDRSRRLRLSSSVTAAHGRQAFALAREAAATRCDLLNRLDEIARSAPMREAVSTHSERMA